MKAKGAKEFGIHAFLASNTVTNEYYPMLAKVLFEAGCEAYRKKQAFILNLLTYPVVSVFLTTRIRSQMTSV